MVKERGGRDTDESMTLGLVLVWSNIELPWSRLPQEPA